jgi:hypothetical protein
MSDGHGLKEPPTKLFVLVRCQEVRVQKSEQRLPSWSGLFEVVHVGDYGEQADGLVRLPTLDSASKRAITSCIGAL